MTPPTPMEKKVNERLFAYDLIRNCCRKPSLWNRFRLLFRPMYRASDISDEMSVDIWFKELDGINYVVNTWCDKARP